MKRVGFLFIIMVAFTTESLFAIADGDQQAQSPTISRFDVEIFNYLKNPTPNSEKKIKDAYPNLLPAFTQTLTGLHLENAGEAFAAIKKYFAHPSLKSIYGDTQTTYADTKELENKIKSVSSRLSTIYPNKKLPKLTFHVSGFKENIIIVENTVSVSIDKYMGENYAAYKNFFPARERMDMTSKSLLRDYLKAWILSDVVNKKADSKQTLLSSMINDGKVLYMLSQLLPEYSVSELMGYTSSQMEWCETNEKQAWREIVKQNHLNTEDYITISKYTADSEFTTLLSKGTPGRISSWIGYKIVAEYVKNSNATLPTIFSADAQSIYKASKYKP